MSKTLADDLRAARALIDTPEKWGKLYDYGLCVLQACNRATGYEPKAAMTPDRMAADIDALRADNERLLQAGITGALRTIELTRLIDRVYEVVRQESASLASSVESFWCMTTPGSDNRLLAGDAERSIKRLRAIIQPRP